MKPPKCITCGNLFERQRFLQAHCSPKCAIKFSKSIQDRAKTENLQKRPVKAKKVVSEPLGYIKSRGMLKAKLTLIGGQLFCQRCKTTQGPFHTHHLIYRSEKPNHKLLHDERNLYICCEPCHTWFHKSKGNRDQIVAERKLNLIFGEDVLNKSKS